MPFIFTDRNRKFSNMCIQINKTSDTFNINYENIYLHIEMWHCVTIFFLNFDIVDVNKCL